jgi:hypothetical protein
MITSVRRLLTAVGVLALVAIPVTASGAGGAPAVYKPVIGKPVTVPTQPVAGKSLVVTFKVTRSDTGTRLLGGRMLCDPSVTGKTLKHAESFRAGTGRLAFVVPASSAGKMLKVKVTIKAPVGTSATRVASYRVQQAAKPSLSIADATVAEGNAGTTTLSFPLTLSAASTQTVSVAYTTADGTATAPADYAAATGTVTFRPGETSKVIAVGVVGDAEMEQNETLTVTASNAVNATLAKGTATGTITNDDTAVPISVGSYQGTTQNGNYVFFTVTGGRTITHFRINDIPCTCDGPLRLTGGENFGDSTFSIRADGSFSATGDWTGSQVQGDVEWLHWDATLTGRFTTATTVTGTIVENYELNYKGRRYRCTTGTITWSATLQG